MHTSIKLIKVRTCTSYVFYGDHVETHAIDDAIVAINAVIVASSAAEASSKWELAPFPASMSSVSSVAWRLREEGAKKCSENRADY